MGAMTRAQRDEIIVKLYREGFTHDELAEEIGLSAERIRQILQSAGVTTAERGRGVRRTAFTGVHLTPDVKEALREEAQRCGRSMSEFIAELVTDYVMPTKE